MHRLPSPGSICLTIYPMRIQKGINATVIVIHNAGRLVKTCRDFLQSLSWGRAEEHNILSTDAFPNCLQLCAAPEKKKWPMFALWIMQNTPSPYWAGFMPAGGIFAQFYWTFRGAFPLRWPSAPLPWDTHCWVVSRRQATRPLGLCILCLDKTDCLRCKNYKSQHHQCNDEN